MNTVVIVLAIIAAAGAVAWFVFNRQNPETAARHDFHVPETRSEQLYDGVDRPAGPDAEPMDPDRLGGDQRPPSD